MNLFKLVMNFLFNINSEPRVIQNTKREKSELNLKLKRIYLKNTYTIGKLFIDNVYFCDTVEDKYRDLEKERKVYGETAIPYGSYEMILSKSTRFKKILPEILDVPYFTGIRIHSGNTSKDTEGCILVGKNKIKGGVIDSRITFNSLMKKLKGIENLTINIV